MGTINTFQRSIGGRSLVLGTGKLATLAHGSVTVDYGDTVVLVTACVSPEPRAGIDFFPLTIDFEEKHYAAGKIPGSFFKREGRPGQEAVLTGRLIDRPLRPLFPDSLRNEVQVVATVLSTDQENDPAIPGIIGASAALSISEIPFEGPVGGSRVGYIDGQFVLNPTYTQLARSDLDLVVVGTKEAVVMVEAGANEVAERTVFEAVKFGQQANLEAIALQEELIRACGKAKMRLPSDSVHHSDLDDAVLQTIGPRIDEAVQRLRRDEREAALAELQKEAVESLKERYPAEAIAEAVLSKVKGRIRAAILDRGTRPDGRGLRDLRELSCEVGVLPRTHGSGMFTRGLTQVLTITTLGSTGEVQKIDNLTPETKKRFIHHYNFPPFSVGETRRLGGPGRREIGHGALAERALRPVIPTEEDFPYTIRLVSEALSSNGSTSMASVCGSSLSLMDAGVPISAPVAGVAIGLVTDDRGRYAVLTDIAGLEDDMGDMDFKVAGTAKGMTAWQMDLKIKGLSFEIMEKALDQAREARIKILDVMSKTIIRARPDLSPHAPRMTRLTIDKEKIGAVIGPGGKMIRSIIEQTGTTIDIEDDGTVIIGSRDGAAAKKAEEIILGLTREVEVGTQYTGKVSRIMSFGAFVEILPGKEGLVHISELADHRVESVEAEVRVGDQLTVLVTEIDSLGRINLSRRAVLTGTSHVRTGDEGEGGPSGYPRPPRGNSPPFRREGRPPERRPFRSDRGPGYPGPRDRRR